MEKKQKILDELILMEREIIERNLFLDILNEEDEEI